MSQTGGTPTPTPTPTSSPAAGTDVPVIPVDGISVPDFVPSYVPPWLFRTVTAIIVLIVGIYAARFARQLLGRRVARRFRRPSVTRTVLRTIQGAVVLVTIFTALAVLGVGLGDLTISLSIFSAVLGFVLAPIIGSVVNGVFILTEQPYEIGDMIHLKERDVYGFVEDITLRYTKIFTLDNTFLVVPNGSMRERDVINFSAEDARTRLSLDVLVTYESDIPEARALVEEAAREVDNVIEGGPAIRIGGARYPAAPTCYIENYGDHGVNLRLRYWATEPYKLLTLRSSVQTNVWERLDDADVEIAYPHSHLVFDETSGEMQVGVRDRAPADPAGRATKRERAGRPDEPGADTDPDATGER